MTILTNRTDSPRVSVLMTIYNAESFLRESINSLIAERFPDWELIAVENGSTDASPSILADYPDPRVRVFPFSENIGRTPALRYAFDQARGEYIAVLDADDISHPERLLREVAFLDEHPDVALVGSWAQHIDERGMVFAEFKPPKNQDELHDCLGWTNPIVHSSTMYRHRLVQKVGGYSSHLISSSDFGVVLELAQHFRIAVIEDFLCQLRVLSTSMSRSTKYRVVAARESLMLFQRAADVLPLSAKALRLNRRAQAIERIKLGIYRLSDGPVLTGLELILRALLSEPSALWGNGPVRRFFGKPF